MATVTHTHSPPRRRTSGTATLPWWAVALPALAFAALLMLSVGAGAAGGGGGQYGQSAAQLLERVERVLPG